MNITKRDIDKLNAVVTVDIKKEDYSEKVSSVLNNYRKTANIPGFRKGHVPMGMVQKQYGKSVLVEEVNKLSYQNAHYMYDKLLATGKFFDNFKKPFLKEFTLETTISHDLIGEALLENNMFGGFSLEKISDKYENLINFAATEKRTKSEIDKLIKVLEGLSWTTIN